MPAIFSDDFTGYGDGALATVSSAGATPWVAIFANDHIVTSEMLKGTSTGPEKIAGPATWSGSTTDQYAQCVVSGTVQYQGPCVHFSASGGYIFEANIDGSHCDIYELNGAGQICVLNGTVSAGQTMYLSWIAGVMIASVDGTPLTVSSGSLSHSGHASGKPAVRIYESGSSNIIDSVVFGDFSGGGDPEGSLRRGKLIRGGLLGGGVLTKPSQMTTRERRAYFETLRNAA